MKVSATTAQTQGRAQTTTNTLQLWNWYAEPILKLQPGHSGTQHREPIKQTAYRYIFFTGALTDVLRHRREVKQTSIQLHYIGVDLSADKFEMQLIQ